MHLEIYVEEPSAEKALLHLIPAIVGREISFRIHVFQGKSDLLAQLLKRLKGYRRWLPKDWRIIVLIDADRQDCRKLKADLERAAQAAGLITHSMAQAAQAVQVINHIAVEELEAWFLGDIQALAEAYPGVPPTLGRRADYRDPDAVRGGTWEALERVLQTAGYYSSGLPKGEAADRIAGHMQPARNRSKSFQVFKQALEALIP